MNYTGVIIEESLYDTSILKKLRIIRTELENVTARHSTPWLSTWTLHTIEIPEENSRQIAEEISHILDPDHSWYADFRNNRYHYIIFRHKVFCVDRTRPEEYKTVKEYGRSLGIPEHQLDFE